MKINHSRLFFAFCALVFSFILPAAEIGREWTLFGPYYRLMHRLPAGLEGAIPEKLRVGSQTQSAVTARHQDGKLDIAAAMGQKIPHRAFYICIPIRAAKAETLTIGAGADWWMDLYLNGKPVGDTLMDGNVEWPPTSHDHRFTLNLKAGDNLLVVGVIGGGGSQQLVLKANPVFPAGYPLVPKAQFGQEQMPSLAKINSLWEKGKGADLFQPTEYALDNGILKLSPKIGRNGRKYFAVKLHLEPGKQYCLNWSAWTTKGPSPVVLIQERPDGGAVYFAKELVNGRNRTGYFYAENPEPYALIEMRGTGVTELSRLSLKQRLDRSAAFQDWRIQRFPAPAHLQGISRKRITPHFDYAPKLPGGTLKVFAITSFWRQGLRQELEQRFDFRTDGVFTNGNAAVPPHFWTRDAKGNAYLKNGVDDMPRAKSADCIYVNACGASALSPAMVKTILQQVERGAGLVICAFEQPYYPYKDGKRQAAVDKLRALFGAAFKTPATQDTAYVSIAAASNLKAEFGTYGKGRVVLLMEAENVMGYERVFFEIQEALVGKAMLWATGRVPSVRLQNVRQTEAGVAFGVTSPSEQQRVSLVLSDMACRELKTAEMGAKDGDNSFSADLNEIGKYPAIIRLVQNGVTLDWDVALLEKKGQGLFTEMKVRKHAPLIEGYAVLARKPAPGETMACLLKDGEGALWKRWTQPAKSKTYFKLPAEGIAAVGGTLTLQLVNPQGEVLDQTSADVTLSTGDDPENIDFSLGVWGVPMDTYSSWLYHKTIKDAYGLDYRLTGNHPKLPWQLQKMNIRSVPMGAPGQMYFGKDNKIKNGPHAPERELCLSSDALKKSLAKTIRAISTPLMGIDTKCYFMDHETNLLGYINKAKPGSDYCFSPSCRASLAELVKSEYGTLDKLNAAWGTTFKAWEEVTPIVLKDALPTGNAARWIDHRRNMDKVWTDLLKFRIRELRKYDPKAMGYIQNLHSAYSSNDSFSGIDYEQMLECDLGAGAMPESYINAFSPSRNRYLNAQGGAMWYPFSGAVDDPKLNSLRASRVIWQTILLGGSCCLYYLHNFNDHGGYLLFNDIFLVNPDMTLSPEGQMLSEELRKMHQGIDRLVLSAKADNSGIEMLYSRSSEHACTFWQAMVGKECTESKALNPRQQQFEFFAPAVEDAERDFASTGSRLLKDGGLAKRGVKLLILPFAQSISPDDAREIRAFVQAGGCLLADFRPAIADQHGILGDSGLLDDVFGVRQRATWEFRPRRASVAFGKWNFRQSLVGEPLQLTTAKPRGRIGETPVFLENRFGKGRAVLLNFSTQDAAFSQLFGEWLDSCGIPRLFNATIRRRTWRTGHGLVNQGQIRADQVKAITDVQDKSATEDAGERETQVYQNTSRPKLHRFTSGAASVIGYYGCRRGFALGQGDMEVDFAIPSEGFVYDLIEGKSLGKTSSWKVTMPLEGVKLYGILPFEAQAPALGKPVVDEVDGARRVRVSLTLLKEAASIAYPVRITPVTPDGRPLDNYARTVTVRNSQAEISLLLPADAAKGEWSIAAREVFAGKTVRVAFRL